MNKIGAKRLLKLADLLDDLPVKEFDLGRWYYTGEGCGTVACAVGHACLSPKFPGLVLNDYRSPSLKKGPEMRDMCVVESYFSLTYEHAWHLFIDKAYPLGDKTRPKIVANRIRKFVEASHE